MSARIKLSRVAYDRFKERLFSSDMRPGQFVSQRELVGLTGVALGPMREALQKLETEGLVQIVPQRGIQVADANLKLIRNTFHLRMLIEREAARRFAETAPTDEIDRLIDTHKQVLDDGRDGVDAVLLAESQRVDMHMHDAMVDHLGNEILCDIHRVNMDRIRLIRLDHHAPTIVETSILEHLAVLEACRERDQDAAVHAMELHISMALRRAMGL